MNRSQQSKRSEKLLVAFVIFCLFLSSFSFASNPFHFSTKYYDQEVGLYNFGYRHYDPNAGRWLNRDPIQENGGANLYGFVGNNPLTGIDPDGRFLMLPLLASELSAPIAAMAWSVVSEYMFNSAVVWVTGDDFEVHYNRAVDWLLREGFGVTPCDPEYEVASIGLGMALPIIAGVGTYVGVKALRAPSKIARVLRSEFGAFMRDERGALTIGGMTEDALVRTVKKYETKAIRDYLRPSDYARGVKYFDDMERLDYLIEVRDGRLYHQESRNILERGEYYYVMDECGNIFAGKKNFTLTTHAQFLAGRPAAAAGKWRIEETGRLYSLNKNSGHYLPENEHLEQIVNEFEERGISRHDYDIAYGLDPQTGDPMALRGWRERMMERSKK